MEGKGDPSPVRMRVMAVAPSLAIEDEAIGLEGESELASGKRPEAREFDTHTLTATSGRSETVTLAGRDSPSSSSASITICATSWIFLSASSSV
jgi:hypothetical protein